MNPEVELTRILKGDSNRSNIHIFFCVPKKSKPGFYHVLGNKEDETHNALNRVYGFIHEYVDFQTGSDPESLMVKLEHDDLTLSAKGCDIHLFCLVQHRNKVVECFNIVKDYFQRKLILHTGNYVTGWASFSDDGFGCGSLD